VLVLGAACAALLAACSPGADQESRRGVLVIAVDALRADHVSAAGYDRQTTPVLDMLSGKGGVLFTRAFSAAPTIIAAHVALLTGCDPSIARTPHIELPSGRQLPPFLPWTIPDQVPRLATELLARGWSTAAFVDHNLLLEQRGFRQGFIEYAEAGHGTAGKGRRGFRGVGTRFYRWLEQQEGNWFAYLHVGDIDRMWSEQDTLERLLEGAEVRAGMGRVPPRATIDPVFHAVPSGRAAVDGYSYGELETLYDAALAELDAGLGGLFLRMQEQGAWRDTTIVVVGSHGFSFGESGLIVDNGSLTPADLHVPLFFRPADGLVEELSGPEQGQVHEHPALSERLISTIDLAPSLLELHGYTPPGEMHGESFVSALLGMGSEQDVRRVVHASQGVYGGGAATDGVHLYERGDFAKHAPPGLTASWFGYERLDGGAPVLREALYSVAAPRVPGRMHATLDDPSTALELRAESESWEASVDTLRRIQHSSGANRPEVDPDLVRDLVQRGWLGADVAPTPDS